MVKDDDILKLTSCFVILCLAQAISGIWLYLIRYGFDIAGVVTGFFGNQEKIGISWITWAKVTGPHLFAISLMTFALAHLLAFSEGKYLRHWAIGLIFSGIIHTLSGALVLQFGPSVAIIKLITFLLFQFYFAAVSWLILKSVVLSQRT
jgi:hypothetical protein